MLKMNQQRCLQFTLTKSQHANTAAIVAISIVSITSSTFAVHAYSTYPSRALTSALRDTKNSKQDK
jgi:hypothetical protein